MNEESRMRYPSKVDLWVSLLLWGCLLMIALALSVISPEEQPLYVALAVPLAGFLLWILYGTWYELRDGYLLCRMGPFFERIRYESIGTLRTAHGMASSMALSARRIEIRQRGKSYITGTTYISPLDRDGFLVALAARCPNLTQTAWTHERNEDE